MPTAQSKNTSGTPHNRAANLVGLVLDTLEADHPARAPAQEAFNLISGEEEFLEKYSSELIVPRGHKVEESEVRSVWAELLKATEEADWKQLKAEGKTQFELQAGMCSGAYEAVALQQLALLGKSTSVLEIGVFTGTATLALGLLPSVKHITALDVEPFLVDFDSPYWERAGVKDKIDFRIAPALESLKKLQGERHEGFDFVFIDADKPSYPDYVQSVLDLGLLKEGGVILADNTLYKGYPWAPPGDSSASTVTSRKYTEDNGTRNKSGAEASKGIHDFNTFVRDHPGLETVILPIRDGVFGRLNRLLSTALSSTEPSSAAHAPLTEAYTLSSRLEPYLSRNSNELIVPRSHPVDEGTVRRVWEDLLRETKEHDWEAKWKEGKMQWRVFPGMCSGSYEATVLQHFGLLLRPKRVLEIGVFTGTATLALALLPSVERVVALDIEPYLKEFSTPYWEKAGVEGKIDYPVAPAGETLEKLAAEGAEGFDLIFIDADKTGYQGYVQAILEKGLLNEDGVILADNTLGNGRPFAPSTDGQRFGPPNWLSPEQAKEAEEGGVDPRTKAIDDFNQWVADHPDLEVVQLPIRDGISVIRRRV
ncbi:hypothetical protein JCM8097_008155 [Rhodosporidiobolus ruineniae]